MKVKWTQLAVLLAMVLVLAVPLAFRSSPTRKTRVDTDAGGARLKLVIYSPHNDQIRHEFAVGFNRWRQRQNEPPVEFDWRAGGGTTDIRKKIIAEFHAKARNGREAEGIGADLLFGGGNYEHNKLARGIEVQRNGSPQRVKITTPVRFDDGQLSLVFPEPLIGSERLYHQDLSWAGAALASFGIVYNRDVLRTLGLDEPRTWSDLQQEQYRGWIALADPGHSGSITATYNAILRRMGWAEGWGTLRRVFANARCFTASASKVPVDVSAGEAAAGMCIDFYGRYQAGAIGGQRVGYVDPPFMTAITADPISILRGAPQQELANQFVLWLLSKDGQGLWQRRCGTDGGPQRFELRRLPVRRDMYNQKEMADWADQVRPFGIAMPFPERMPDFFLAVSIVSHAMAIDVHDDLAAAWAAIVCNPRHPRRQEMLDLFDKMPPALTLRWKDADMRRNWQAYLADSSHQRHEATAALLNQFVSDLYARWKHPDDKLRDRLRWTVFFRQNYRQIVRIAGEN